MQGGKQRRCRRALGDQGDQGKPGEPRHRRIGRGRALGREWGGIGSGTCLVVLMTRMELEHVSEIALLQKPMRALRKRNMGSSVLRS